MIFHGFTPLLLNGAASQAKKTQHPLLLWDPKFILDKEEFLIQITLTSFYFENRLSTYSFHYHVNEKITKYLKAQLHICIDCLF